MAKPNITVIRENPILVTISKNKRGVSQSSAQAALKKYFPEVPDDDWCIYQADHKTRAYRISQGPSPQPFGA